MLGSMINHPFLDITIIDNNSYDIEYEYGIGDDFEYKNLGVKSFSEVKDEINKFSKKDKDRFKENEGWKKNLKNISAFSIYNITSVRANQDFRIKHSSHLKMRAKSQYLMMNAAKTNMPTVHVHI